MKIFNNATTLVIIGLFSATNLFGGATDSGSKNSTQELHAPDKVIAVVNKTNIKYGKSNRTSPAVARVPTKKIMPAASKQEQQFSKLKASLQGPEGLLHLGEIRQFVTTWPEHTLARLWLIRGLINKGAVDEAVSLLGEQGKWKESDWQVGFWKANVQILAGELELAKAEMNSAFVNESKNTDIWVQRAVLEQESGNHQVAIQLLRIAVKLNPDHALANLNLGHSLEHESLIPEALAAYQNFLTSDNSQLYHLRVPVLNHIGELVKFVASRQTSTTGYLPTHTQP
ncbi:MAG: tetratricopeptide repeat protein [Granulosicoccus sp.]